jgi:hypothetical protein
VCDLGFAIGIASGALTASAKAEAAARNQEMLKQQALLEYGQQQREFIVESDAALKESHEAALEGQRAKSFVAAKAAGMGGATAGEQIAEQSSQTSLNINKAKDRRDNAKASNIQAGRHTQIETYHRLRQEEYTSQQAMADIIGSGLSSFGGFK